MPIIESTVARQNESSQIQHTFNNLIDKLYEDLFFMIRDNQIPQTETFLNLCKIVQAFRDESRHLRRTHHVDFVRMYIQSTTTEPLVQAGTLESYHEFNKIIDNLYEELFFMIRDNHVPHTESFLNLCKQVQMYRSVSRHLHKTHHVDFVKEYIQTVYTE